MHGAVEYYSQAINEKVAVRYNVIFFANYILKVVRVSTRVSCRQTISVS